MGLSLDKIEKQAPALVSLVKTAQISLSKANLNGQVAKVALCLDYSGSMSDLYRNGTVQKLSEQVLALGTQFDDDGAIDVFVFDSGAAYLGEIGIGDYHGAVDRLTRNRSMGSTNYAAAMRLVREHYAPPKKGGLFRKHAAGPMDFPVYCMFITDGAPDSEAAATQQLVDASREGIFWQFMGLGHGPFHFLQELDENVPGRLIDNANFFAANGHMSDGELYEKMLAEFPGYIPQARAKGLIA